jgi:uncharacterized DUF497 family protein
VANPRPRRFSWDEKKRQAILRAGRPDLADVARAFEQPPGVVRDRYDPNHSDAEDRWQGLLMVGNRIGLVIYSVAEKEDVDEFRLITAWWADKEDQAIYWQAWFGEMI